jgi:hypothetical protein
MKRSAFIISTLFVVAFTVESGIGNGGFPKVDPEKDDFEVLLSPGKSAISCFHDPSQFFVILKNKTKEPKKLFEYWNSWGYQNISFYFYMKDGLRIVTRKNQDFTRNFPSTYEVAAGETMVFPLKFDNSWDKLPNIAEGESKVRMQVIYNCNPSFDAKETQAWTGIIASKIYEVNFWRAHAETIERQSGKSGLQQPPANAEPEPKIK